MTAAAQQQHRDEISNLLKEASSYLERDQIPLNMIADPRIFELEVEKLWSRTWNFLAHESEIPKPGDYVVRNIGPYDSIIVVRNEAEVIQAFANICPHRGMRLCRADMGNSSHFRCPYHGWTFKNNDGRLVGVPFREKAYGNFPVLEKHGLKEVRAELYNGMIFGNLDDDAKSLNDFLGDFKWYIDLVTKRTEKGVEFSRPLRYVADFNWKIAAENTGADNYHLVTTHRANVELGLALRGEEHFNGYQTSTQGHMICCLTGGKAKVPRMMDVDSKAEDVVINSPAWSGFPDLAKKSMKSDQFEAYKQLYWIDGNLFPNLMFTNSAKHTEFRLVRSISPNTTEILAWSVYDKESAEEAKQASRMYNIKKHSLAGVNEQDDVEVWRNITMNSRSISAKKMTMNYDVGVTNRKNRKDWIGPGDLVVGTPNELAAISMWKELLNYLQG